MKRVVLIILLFVPIASAFGQNSPRSKGIQSLGIESQIYPAGTMFNLRASWLLGEKSSLIGKLGYNTARRQDFGEHDKEDGGGLGLALGYRRYLDNKRSGLFMEGRASAWFLDIDWQDNAPLRTGNSDITVFQPTIGIGYDILLNDGKIKLGLLVAFGYEVNMITSGEAVGQGGISLIGLSVDFRL